jgi:hypothetical protein
MFMVWVILGCSVSKNPVNVSQGRVRCISCSKVHRLDSLSVLSLFCLRNKAKYDMYRTERRKTTWKMDRERMCE